MKTLRWLLLVAWLTAAAEGWLIEACGPFYTVAVFSFQKHPDLPRSGYIDGRLGILQPTFARSYLILAYRYLNGIGLNAREREQARDYYKDRATGDWDHTGADWLKRWQTARAQVRSVPVPATMAVTSGQLAYDPDAHAFELNCADDAFRVALRTLGVRKAQFGERNPAFLSWVKAQDAVFANCEKSHPVIPAEATAQLPPLIRADRDYQIASAHFYAGDYPEAVDRFRRISHESESPWNELSRYLIARTLLREIEGQASAAQAAALRTTAQQILSDPRLAGLHGMTLNLLDRARMRAKDPEYFRSLARLLSMRGQDDGLREELWNYTILYDHLTPSDFADSDLTAWLYNFQSTGPEAATQSIARWRRMRSTGWLLAALTHAGPRDAEAAGLIAAASAIPTTSPAYLTARYHLYRLDLESGNRPDARRGLDALLASPTIPTFPSSVNLLRGLRMQAAPTLSDFLQFASRNGDKDRDTDQLLLLEEVHEEPSPFLRPAPIKPEECK